MDETIPTDLNILTVKSRMKVLNSLQPSNSSETANKDRRERLLSKAIDELVSTEKSYQKSLNLLIDFFMVPLQEKNLVSAKEFNIIFGQIDTICSVNRELLIQLELNCKPLGEAVLELAPFFKVYSAYVKGFNGAAALIETLQNENKEFARFISNQESRPEVAMKLNALLIAPVQRIPRYKLLLEEIIQHSLPGAADYELLKDALQEVISIGSIINNCMHEHDNMQKMLQIQQSLTNDQPKILIPGRRFIKEGPLMKVSRNGNRSHRRIFFLFSDILMYCKPLAPDYSSPNTLMCGCVIPLKHCKVDALFNSGLQSGTLMTINCKDECIILYTDNAEDGNSWLDALKSTIRQYSEFRQTLKKASTAKRPLRRAAILKQQEESLSKLSKKRKAETDDQDKVKCPEHVKDVLFPMRDIQKVQNCITPKKKQKLHLASDDGIGISAMEDHEQENIVSGHEKTELHHFVKSRLNDQNSDQGNFPTDEPITLYSSSSNEKFLDADLDATKKHSNQNTDSSSTKGNVEHRCIIL